MRTLTATAALILLAGLWAGSPASSGHELLDQGWSDADRRFYYATSQGSRMMPAAWFAALERPGSRALFAADGLARYGYVESPYAQPAGLPIGFAVDTPRRDPWVGVTCAACHLGEITFRGRAMLVDGAPSGADYFRFLQDLGDAVTLTIADRQGPRFERFAGSVLGAGAAAEAADGLYAELRAWSADWTAFVGGSAPEHPWGPGRLDGFGLIFNRVAGIALDRPDNIDVLGGPVSYPFLWTAPWHDRLQWNGSVVNLNDLDRLGRNAGQVLGNFARARLRKPGRGFYRTSVRRGNMVALENLVKRLAPPVWPEEILGPIDRGMAAVGARLYGRHCASCHPRLGEPERQQRIRVVVTPVAELGTDPAMARDYCNRTLDPGRLEGASMPPVFGTPLPDPVSADAFLDHVVSGSLLDLQASPLASSRGATPSSVALDCGPEGALMVYKATPLHGIWATAPYLHNGAVASLYELLLPPGERRRVLWIGSRELDTRRVGFVSRRGDGAVQLDTTLPGNSRLGHAYATDRLTDEQRWQLVEYLKTL